ncbi:uncharacterized protein TRAVEDRAFT_132624, partial [Trametes versicolor FP-101664 SS1]|uniref:uncharacterized protein n=1 Tax=Trametes versicolor (strain FP-101664) TaxID=717944 RepID=UPI0004623BFD
YHCPVCSKAFPRPSILAIHMDSHSGAKPFKCPVPVCTKSYAVRSNLRRHLRTHNIVEPAEHVIMSPLQLTVE